MDAEGIAVVVPALDEEPSIGGLLSDLASLGLLRSTVVVDNGSRDRTAEIATAAGARCVREPRKGYGAACLKGIGTIARELPATRIVVFLDADRSDDPSALPSLVAPIREGRADLVLGARSPALSEKGALLPHQRWGNAIVCLSIRLLFGRRFADLGPFRAIALPALERLEMRDTGYGWTAEMQVKAIRRGLRIAEIPVPYRRRVGVSKISGTFSGSTRAALKIGWTVARLRFGRG